MDLRGPAASLLVALSALAAPPSMTNLNPPTPRPSARTGPASALTRTGPETFWIFGGNATLAGTNNQLWAYDVSANTWTQRTVTGLTPSNRAWSAMSWDEAQQRLVVFGGSTDLNGPLLGDVRLFDPATNAWAAPMVMGTPPSPRFLSRLVYVPHQGWHLLFGGGTATSANAEATALTNELWALTVNAAVNTVTWQLLAPAGTPPSVRATTCMVVRLPLARARGLADSPRCAPTVQRRWLPRSTAYRSSGDRPRGDHRRPL